MFAAGPVLELQTELRHRIKFDDLPVPDVAFTLEHIGQATLHQGHWDIYVRPLYRDGVPDAGQHIRDWVSQHITEDPSYQLALRTPGINPLSARLRKQIRQM